MQIHVVQQDETLEQIAQTYDISTDEILKANKLPNGNLMIGLALVIPSPTQYHTVKPGEYLWKIAQQYDTTVSAIIKANNISNPDLIYPGTVLAIPPAPVVSHTVKPGETLWQISQIYGVTIQNIVNTNQISNPDLIYPGTVLIVPKDKPTIEVNAYIYQTGEQAAQTVAEAGPHLTYLSPFAYGVKPDGGLASTYDDNATQAALSEKALPMMCISNFTSQQLGSDIAHTILADTAIQDILLKNIEETMKAKGYRGINIDFENVLPADRELYSSFIQRSADFLRPKGYFISTALAPKTSSEQKGLLYEAHDYAAHGRIADFVILMTYEWGYRSGPPQAISPLDQIRRVLDYAISVIPKNKIFMGFQIYARDWTLPHVQGQQAETFSPQEAVQRAIQYRAPIQYNQTAESPFFRYEDKQGISHEVWFEDARSAQAKFNTVKEYNLRGISYWVLGYPSPQNWLLLDDNFNISKYR